MANVKMEEKNTLACIKLQNICRICFSSDGTLYSIFDNDHLIITMLNSFIEKKVEEENYDKNMPSKICENCLRKLNNCFQFKQQCRDVEARIEKVFASFKKTNKSENIYLFKHLDSNYQNLTVNKLVESIPNIFECDGHIFIKSSENLDVSNEYLLHESLFQETLNKVESPESYEDIYQENDVSADVSEIKSDNEEKSNIFKINIKFERTHSAEFKQNSDHLISETEINSTIHPRVKSEKTNQSSKSSNNTNKSKSNSNKKTFKMSSDDIYYKLREKLKNLESREQNLLCLICKQTFTQARILKAHVQTHILEQMKSFACKHCDKKFKMRQNLKRHERIHSGERPYKCNICEKSFFQSFTMKEHMFIHDKTKGWECSMCHKVFRGPAALKKHKKGCQQIAFLETSHKCTICLKSFSSFLGLNAHARVHAVDSSFECSKCQIKFSAGHFLTEHNLLHHGNNKLTDNDFTCSVCEKKLFSFAALVSHQEIHDNNASFLCNFCGKSCSSKHSFTIHLRRHTGERPFPCEHCAKKFISKASLDKHTNATHNDIRPYTCDVCRKRFRQACHLIVHKRIHTDERPFGCEFCGKRFRIKRSVDIHLRIHTGEKPHSCDNCLQTFSDPSSFRKHTLKCKNDNNIKTVRVDEFH